MGDGIERRGRFWEVVEERAVEFGVSDVVRMHKPGDGRDDSDPTAVLLTDGRLLLLEESTKTILARLGDTDGFEAYDHPGSERAAWFNLSKAVLLTKPFEDCRDDDPTDVLLESGGTVRCTNSIRTLSARLNARGIDTVELDIDGTERPAAAVTGHVLTVDEGIVCLTVGVTLAATCEAALPALLPT